MPDRSFFHEWLDFVPALKAKLHEPILQKVAQLRNEGKVIYPTQEDIFTSLKLLSPQNTSVIILGQDPYHQEGQAHGLAFSVQNNTAFPPSLKNIFKEIKSDVYADNNLSPNCNLSAWAKQGVLLLNTVLTVEQSKPLSHAKLGWQAITHSIVQSLAARDCALVVLLWGKTAQGFAPLFYNAKHLVLCAAHPSPLSASRGFFGCKHFTKANSWLIKHQLNPIIW